MARIQHDVIFALSHIAAGSSSDLLFEDVGGNPLVNFAYSTDSMASFKSTDPGQRFRRVEQTNPLHDAMVPTPGLQPQQELCWITLNIYVVALRCFMLLYFYVALLPRAVCNC